MAENENIQILEVAGRRNAEEQYLHQTIHSMDLMSELTKSEKGMYHAQINPAYGEDKNIDWFKAADMLGTELGLEHQRRVIVLHEKKGRTHAHVVWERYDYETGTMKSDSFSRLAQDRARQNMEVAFGHKQTPRRNQHKPELKASLTQLWNQTGTGAQFITACKNNDYMIAQGSGRNPFIVVDLNGHSFDLTRQLKGVRLKDVRQRLRNETLITEKEAIVIMRNKKSERDAGGREKQKAQFNATMKDVAKNIRHEFSASGAEATKEKQPASIPSEKPIATQFAENRQETELQRMRRALAEQRKSDAQKQHDRSRDKGMDYG
ncbi:relaxase/mobilization nuclease domain-containing protein [Mucilaginibacter pedocola]|nr:relaxase [Mucilaginibacter pedocola]